MEAVLLGSEEVRWRSSFLEERFDSSEEGFGAVFQFGRDLSERNLACALGVELRVEILPVEVGVETTCVDVVSKPIEVFFNLT